MLATYKFTHWNPNVWSIILIISSFLIFAMLLIESIVKFWHQIIIIPRWWNLAWLKTSEWLHRNFSNFFTQSSHRIVLMKSINWLICKLIAEDHTIFFLFLLSLNKYRDNKLLYTLDEHKCEFSHHRSLSSFIFVFFFSVLLIFCFQLFLLS